MRRYPLICLLVFAANILALSAYSRELDLPSLTEEDIRRAKLIYPSWEWGTVQGYRLEDQGRAVVWLLGNMHRTEQGLCFKPSFTLGSVPIVDDLIDWKPFNPEHSINIEYQVWFPRAGEKLNCAEVADLGMVRVNGDIEQNTLLRLYREAPTLLLEAATLDPRMKIPENIGQARVESIGIQALYHGGHYAVELMVRECLGFSVELEAGAAGEFKPVAVNEIVC